jgi:chaperonin GroES
MNIRPIGDLILIRRAAAVEMSAGGIVLAPVSQEELQEGEIVACGPGKHCQRDDGSQWVRPMSVKSGDRVLFSRNGHQVVKINGEEFVALREDSVVGVLMRTASQDMAAFACDPYAYMTAETVFG